ncbi:MAG: KilA-N domain-containing protein [Bacteroidaceae bacterium]|nr:KilA-N domain-containing protein [Bacteroidaceae bacterium]
MGKIKNDTLHVKGIDVGIYTEDYRNEYISLTDIARYRNSDDPRFAIQNWMRNRNTIEFLGLWESLHNPNFNRVQFDTFKTEADMLNVALFGMTAAQWRVQNPGRKGNIRDYASLQQLLVLANMESYNALLIEQRHSQGERLMALRQMAVRQLQVLSSLDISSLPQLPSTSNNI